MFKVMEVGDGVEIEGPTGPINVYLEPVQNSGEVLIKAPGDDIGKNQCRIHGNTYQHKDLIKKLPYGHEGSEWTGEVWAVNKEMTTELAAVLTIAGVDVTIEGGAVAEDDGWGHLREEIELPGDDNASIQVMVGPSGPGDKVSRSWAEDAAEKGNYDSVEEFAEQFNLDVASDEEMQKVLEDDDDEGGADVFSSE